MTNYDNFVFYGDIMNSLEQLPTEQDKEKVALAILRYGTSGEWTDDNLYCRLILPLVKPGIDKAKDRYNAAVENGRKGGRPKVELDEDEVLAKKTELGTWRAVAEFYRIDEDTLRKVRKSWEKTEKPKNLNNNINININKNKNINENENSSPISFYRPSDIMGWNIEEVEQGLYMNLDTGELFKIS